MKTLTYLPDVITTPDGTKLKVVIGLSQSNRLLAEVCKAKKWKYRIIGVLQRNLRGKLDLHRRPYTPTIWFFCENVEGLKSISF